MELLLAFILAILPILVIFVGLVLFRKSGTYMGIAGWALTVAIAVLFFSTTPDVALRASAAGILSSFGISLMVLFTILQVTMMDKAGAIDRITAFIKTIAAEKYEQIMILNVGLGSLLVSIGATPVTMLPPIMIALGFSPLAAVALPCLGYDPLTSFSLLAVPITLPAQVFNLDLGLLASNISLFLPVVSTGFALGMLWVAEGMAGVRKGFVPALVAGLTLGISAIVFVRLLPYIGVQFVQLVGVFAGLMAIIALFSLRLLSGKPIFVKGGTRAAADGGARMPLWKALLPWGLLIVFCILISIPFISTALHDIPGGMNKVAVYANKVVDLKILNQAYFWVLVSTILSAPFLISSKGQAVDVLKTWARRAWSPTLAAAVFFAIAYVMDYSAQSVANGTLAFAAGAADLNMNAVIGLSLAAVFGTALFPAVSPLLGLFGCFVSGSEASSNVMFHGILKKSTGVLDLDFMKVYAAHAVAGGIASGISPAKIVNAAAVIDRLGIEGEVIRKSAVVSVLLTLIVGAILFVWIAL